MEPILISRLFTIFDDIFPLKRLRTNMIKYRIQHDFHATMMRLIHQFPKGLLVSKMTVNFKVICRIVLVIACRFKDGTKI
ncbi:Uncharacterised protein [Streptococcus pneumoniae]|nr:Uncharacterised protein [Streptococcus pneumoniae]